MEEKSGAFQIDHYIELALKHRWYLIIPFCLSMVIGIILIFVLPKTYSASTLILVRPQSVPTDYVQSIVTSDIEARLSTISQQILSRTNLEKIIGQFNLFMGPDQEDMYMEDKVADLRSRIVISLEVTENKRDRRAGEAAEMFSISFTGKDPEVVARVVNGLTALFIDENMRVREAQATGTTDFLDDELKTMRQRLETVELKLRDYRKANMGELPEQLETNLRMLDRLQMQLTERQESLRSAKDRLAILENQIKASRDMMTATATEESGETMTLPQMRQQLVQLQTLYTDRHPDVIRLKGRIAEMEARINAGEISPNGTQSGQSAEARSTILTGGPYNDQIRQREEINFEIRNLAIDIRKIEDEIRKYQLRVENTPRREEELLSLQRDYENIKSSYNNLLNRKLEADIAVNMEKKQKGEQFQIIDRARVPLNPVSPNLKMIFIMSVFLGLNFGVGLIFLKDYFDTSLKRSEEIERDLGISVLATIPRIYQTRDFRRLRLRKVVTVFSLSLATCLFGVFAVLALIGPETTLEMVKEILSSQSI